MAVGITLPHVGRLLGHVTTLVSGLRLGLAVLPRVPRVGPRMARLGAVRNEVPYAPRRHGVLTT